jgi:hypothetical protein
MHVILLVDFHNVLIFLIVGQREREKARGFPPHFFCHRADDDFRSFVVFFSSKECRVDKSV